MTTSSNYHQVNVVFVEKDFQKASEFLEIVIILTLHIKCSTVAMIATVREEYIRLEKSQGQTKYPNTKAKLIDQNQSGSQQ